MGLVKPPERHLSHNGLFVCGCLTETASLFPPPPSRSFFFSPESLSNRPRRLLRARCGLARRRPSHPRCVTQPGSSGEDGPPRLRVSVIVLSATLLSSPLLQRRQVFRSAVAFNSIVAVEAKPSACSGLCVFVHPVFFFYSTKVNTVENARGIWDSADSSQLHGRTTDHFTVCLRWLFV